MAGVQNCYIAHDYLNLKLEELFLAHEYQEKLQEEKEEQRRIREQIREEEVALRELEKARLDAEKEEKRYVEALRKATEDAERAVGEKQQKLMWQVEELQRRLAEARTNKERAIAQAQLTRSGHVYVISNVGSFGEQVYKIGMTRRLDPMDRVKELGDASVPFPFDVHAIIYSEDAPALENKLHKLFHQRRVNLVNERKEFFRVSIDEIATAVRVNHGEIDITLAAEAAEYRKTVAMLQEGQQVPVIEATPQAALSLS
jgi:multidrug efflux pump subunit AcrA (membrane-fusion protein)